MKVVFTPVETGRWANRHKSKKKLNKKVEKASATKTICSCSTNFILLNIFSSSNSVPNRIQTCSAQTFFFFFFALINHPKLTWSYHFDQRTTTTGRKLLKQSWVALIVLKLHSKLFASSPRRSISPSIRWCTYLHLDQSLVWTFTEIAGCMKLGCNSNFAGLLGFHHQNEIRSF